MKPPPFEYHAPSTLEEALSLLAEHGGDAKPLAGGQSLLPMLNFRLARPAVLVDLNGVEELGELEPTADGGLRLGAMVRQRRAERDPLVASRAPLLAEALLHVAHPQIRNRGTVGGSIAHADPAAEIPAVALALGARLVAVGPSGERRLEAADFFLGPFTTALAPEELLVAIELPGWAEEAEGGEGPMRHGSSFEEVARRHGDYALAAVGVRVSLDADGRCRKASIACVNLGPVPLSATSSAGRLLGEIPGPEAIREVAEAVAREVDPPSDIHASAAYRRRLARVLAERALARAVSRAAGDGR